MYLLHKWTSLLGVKVTFLHFKKIGLNCLDIKYFSQVPANPLTMKFIHEVYKIEGNILVRSHIMVDNTVVDRVINSITESYGNRNNNGTTRGAKCKLECLNLCNYWINAGVLQRKNLLVHNVYMIERSNGSTKMYYFLLH